MNENGNDTMANDLDQEKQNVSRVVQKGKNAIRVAKKLKSLKKGKNAIGVAKKMAALKSIAAFIAANPAVFVIIMVAIIIIIITIVFVCIMYYLSSGGVLTALKGLVATLATSVTAFSAAITDIWRDLLGADGHWGLQTTQVYEVSEDLYDPDNDIDQGLIEMYKLEHQLLKNAYNHAVDMDIKAKAHEEGWNYHDICDALNAKYPHGYEDVYSNINWGELAVVLDFGFNSGFYTSDTSVTAKSEDAASYIQRKFVSDAVNGRSSIYMKYFYYLSYSVSTDEDGNVVVDPTIHTYSWTELYNMFGIDPDDIAIEGETTCYIDLQEQMLNQMKAQCRDEFDRKRVIFDTLQLDNDFTPWSYDFPNESVEDYLLGDIVDNSCPVSVITPFDTSEWYTDVPNVAQSTALAATPTLLETYQGWLNLYSGPTATAGATSYFVNTEKATQDIISDMTNNGINVHYGASNWCGYEFGPNKRRTVLQGVTWEQGEGGSAVKNGRYLIAVAPGIVYRNYWANTGGVSLNASWYEYGTKKMDLVLQENSTGTLYYVPVTTGDAKGHSFPYGMIQTGIHTPNSMSEQISGASFATATDEETIRQRDFAYSNLGTAADYYSVMRTFNDLTIEDGYSAGIGQWMMHGAIEWCYKSTTMNLQALRSRFKLKGVIVY
jgi:hypothetical protein